MRKVWCLPLDAIVYRDFEKAWYSGDYWREVLIQDRHGAPLVVKKTVQGAAQARFPRDPAAGNCTAAHFADHLEGRGSTLRSLALWRWLHRSGGLIAEAEVQQPEIVEVLQGVEAEDTASPLVLVAASPASAIV